MAYGDTGHHPSYPERSSSRKAMPNLRRRFPQKLTYSAATAFFILFLYYALQPSSPSHGFQDKKASRNLPCRSLPGADDTVVIMKTGATELLDKLPIHIETTLRCYPHYMIFSDYKETLAGEHVYDALEFANPKLQDEHVDFELWRRLQAGGRTSLKPNELSGPVSKPQLTNIGKPSNPGWKLDKWKFLPMVNRTLHQYPDKKWYVFLETDSYVLWQTLLNYLAALDWTEPYYVGAQVWIGDVEFAHGGTGFTVSRPALENVVKMFQENQDEWEKFTDGHWAGDCVLGKAFKDSGTPLTAAWPIWQGDDIGNMNYDRTDNQHRLWCNPTVAYHHLSPYVVEELWNFEQDWIAETKGDTTHFLRHKDMFAQYVLPRIAKPRPDWSNHADEDRGPVHCLQDCESICERDGGCVQYRLTSDMRCMSTTRPNLGEWSKGVESGWMVDRITKWSDARDACEGGGEGWIT